MFGSDVAKKEKKNGNQSPVNGDKRDFQSSHSPAHI